MGEGRINYSAYCIIPKNRTTTFGDRLEQQNAYKLIVSNGYSVEMDGKECDKSITFEDSCLPIRVTLDRTGEDLGDDWSISSPIIELRFESIVRWWPKKWFIKSDGSLPRNITIHYGEIDICLDVINPEEKIVHDSFAETIISQDHDSAVIDNTIKHMGGEAVMFKKKKPTVEVEEPIEPKIEFETSATDVAKENTLPNQEENRMATEATTQNVVKENPLSSQEERKMTEGTTTEETPAPAKKGLSKKVKVTIAVCTGLAAVGVGVFGFFKLRSLKNGAVESVAE